jgi:hypothetical protein
MNPTFREFAPYAKAAHQAVDQKSTSRGGGSFIKPLQLRGILGIGKVRYARA